MCKKHKLNNLFKSYTYPSLNKAIPNSKFYVSDYACNIKTESKNKLEKSCSKINKLKLLKSNDSKTTMSKRSKISNTKNNKGHNVDKSTKEYQGITALIAIMEPVTESQMSRVYKQPQKGCPSNKIKVLMDSGSDGDLFFIPKGRDRPVPYLARQVPKA